MARPNVTPYDGHQPSESFAEQGLLKTLSNFRGAGRNTFREMGQTLDRANINAYRRRLQAVIEAMMTELRNSF
ncbi:unnamed protein product [Caenorhabditis nigoni]